MTTKIKFNIEIIKFMSMFTSITHTDLKDCIDSSNKILFIVDEKQAGKAIGKQGINVKKLEQKFKKKIKIVEYNQDPVKFIKNLIYPSKIKDIVEEDGVYTITPVDSFTRGVIIGRSASNLREFESIIKRYFEIKEIKVV